MTDDDTIDILPLLDELRTIGRNGLMDAESHYDRERNERLLELAPMSCSSSSGPRSSVQTSNSIGACETACR